MPLKLLWKPCGLALARRKGLALTRLRMPKPPPLLHCTARPQGPSLKPPAQALSEPAQALWEPAQALWEQAQAPWEPTQVLQK